MRFLSILCSALATITSGYSSGVDTCMDVPNHGSWATGCSTTSCSTNTFPLSLHTMSGTPVSSYVPFTNYSIVLGNPNATGACSATTCFRGFIMNVGLGIITGSYTSVSSLSTRAGVMHLDSTDTKVRMMTSCYNGVTHTTNTNVHAHKAIWTSPSSGSGSATFKAVIAVSQNGNNYVSTLVVPENIGSPTASPTVNYVIISVSSLGSILVTSSNTPAVTNSITSSNSVTNSLSNTPAVTNSVSNTPAVTNSITSSNSVTNSLSNTPALTNSITSSNTPALTNSVTSSSSLSNTPAVTSSLSNTPALTNTITSSSSLSNTPALTSSLTNTPAVTSSLSNTPAVTNTPALTNTPTSSYLYSTIIASSFSNTPNPTTTNIIAYAPIAPSVSNDTNPVGFVGLGIAIGVLVTLGILVGYYVIHKRNKSKKPHSSRNILFVTDNPEYISRNPLNGKIVTSSSRNIDVDRERTFFAPTGIRNVV